MTQGFVLATSVPLFTFPAVFAALLVLFGGLIRRTANRREEREWREFAESTGMDLPFADPESTPQ